MKTIKRIVVDASYNRNEPRFARAYELNADQSNPEIDPVIKDYGLIAEGRFDIDEKCEDWGRKTWGKGFEIIFNGIASSETIQY